MMMSGRVGEAIKASRLRMPLAMWRQAARFRVWPVRLLGPLILTLTVVAFYRAWFGPGLITSGDFPYFSEAHLREAVPFPSLWDATSSIGAYNIIDAPMFIVAFGEGVMATLHVGWASSERVLWIFPAVMVPCIATYTLSLALFHRRTAAFISALAIIANTYVYLLYEGGQFGVAVAYGFMPLVLWSFVRGQGRGATIHRYVLTGVVMAIQAMYDIRSTYISLGVCLLYAVFHADVDTERGKGGSAIRRIRSLGVPHLAVALLVLSIIHAWWLLPALFVRAPFLPEGYSNVGGVHALSFMNLSNGLALFHPFWFANNAQIAPINPLFFVVPLLIFALLFQPYNRTVLFLCTVVLIAVFLVKGDNDPAGIVFDWLFVHWPGFSLFRDASKFYQPLALAYSLLLGVVAARWRYALRNAAVWQPARAVVAIPLVIMAVFPAYPALLQQARGAFAANPIPADYARLNNLIDRDPTFFRVLWVPARPRFGTLTALHPALDAARGSPCCAVKAVYPNRSWSWLGSPSALPLLRALAVRYIVVPAMKDDVIGSPGLSLDPQASPRAILASVRAFLPGLREVSIGRLHVFEVEGFCPLVFAVPFGARSCCQANKDCASGQTTLAPHVQVGGRASAIVRSYRSGLSWYDLDVHAPHAPFYVALSQAYDSHWLAYLEPRQDLVSPWLTLFQTPLPTSAHQEVNGYGNAWRVQRSGDYHIILVYWPERLVLLGLLIAAIALLSYVSFLLVRKAS